MSLCLRVIPRPWCRGRVLFTLRHPWRCVRVVALAVAGVVAWRLGCAGGLCVALGGFPCGCTPPPPCVGVPSFPCPGTGGRGARPGVVRALSGLGCGGASWRACASGAVRLVPRCVPVPWGSRAVDWVGGSGQCWSLCCGVPLLSPPVLLVVVVVVLLWAVLSFGLRFRFAVGFLAWGPIRG